jgi:hypothetical protein
MAIEKVGYRILYDSMGCSLKEHEELEVQFKMENINVMTYMGPKPKFGIILMESDKYFVPGETSKLLKANYRKDASKSLYPRKFFTEISCWKELEVSQEISNAFHSKKPKSHEPLINLAHADAELFNSIVDLVAATIGLRFHWQFIIKLINENYIAIRDTNDFAYDMAGQAMKILEGVHLKLKGMSNLNRNSKLLASYKMRRVSQQQTLYAGL